MLPIRSLPRVAKWTNNSGYVCNSCAQKLRLGTVSTTSAKSASESAGRPFEHQQRRWVSRNYIRRLAEAEQDVQQRARDIGGGSKRSLFDVLEERGYVNQTIGSRDELKKLIDNRRVSVYAGVDPTAASLHVGHMVVFMVLGWFYIHGYGATYLLGGATSRIGDPEGRLQPRDAVGSKMHKVNMASMHMQLKRLGQTTETYAARRGYQREWAWRRSLVNNSQWHTNTPILEFMRLLGSQMRIGPMLGRDTVKNRMEKGEGMSLAEFCYPLIQGWDWWELYQKGVQVQIGGADQFGNILAGAEAVKTIAKHDHFFRERLEKEQQVKKQPDQIAVTEDPLGFTVPLLTTASGEKFGKSAGNAVWLDKDMTSIFDLYQFFLRSTDADVEKYLKLFTFLPLEEIKTLMEEHAKDESKRVAQHKLASEFVELIHGLGAAQEAEKQHRELFKKDLTLEDIQRLQQTPWEPANEGGSAPTDVHPRLNKHAEPQTLHANASTSVKLPRSAVMNQSFAAILHSAGLAASRSEAHRLIVAGGAYVGGTSAEGGSSMGDTLNYQKLKDANWERNSKYIIDDSVLVLRSGKWKMKIVKIIPDEEFLAAGLTCPGWPPVEQEEA